MNTLHAVSEEEPLYAERSEIDTSGIVVPLSSSFTPRERPLLEKAMIQGRLTVSF